MTNLFGWMETDRMKMLREVHEPIGPENDRYLKAIYDEVKAKAGMTIAAWGADGKHMARSTFVRRMLPSLYALSMTKHGEPAHPLYLKACLQPIRLPR